MAVIGQTSQTTYQESEILTSRYLKMHDEVLIRQEDDAQVVPVRNEMTPHFREVQPGVYQHRVGPSESLDPTHAKAIAHLMDLCNTRQLVVSTTVFGDGESERQTLFRQQGRDYRWFREQSCRISLGGGRFIEPDLCGRDQASFQPCTCSPTIVIEVIQSHAPDEATYLEQERLSARGYLVIFYFVAPNHLDSRYNRVHIPVNRNEVEITPALYLLGGALYKNGVQIPRFPGKPDHEWYIYVSSCYFDALQKKKHGG